MAVRERINRVRIENWRYSQVAINPAEEIYQGDLLVWDAANKRATKATAASAGTFIGMSESSNPIETIGSTRFLTDPSKPYVNVIQKGLVEVIAGENVTLYGHDMVTVGSDAQTVVKSGANSNNMVGIVDPGFAGTGKAVSSGDLIKVWLKVPSAYATV